MKARYFSFVFAVLLFCPLYAKAQIGVYAEFSAAKVNVPSANWMYGPTFGAFFDRGHLLFLSTGLDVRGAFLGSGNNKLDSGLAGPRLVFRPHVVPIQPYIEGAYRRWPCRVLSGRGADHGDQI